MRTISLLLLLPVLVFSSKGASIPVPKDPQGSSPALTDAMVMDDGTWVVSDTTGRMWWSRDLGAKWDSIPSYAQGNRGDVFGSAVLDNGIGGNCWKIMAGWGPWDDRGETCGQITNDKGAYYWTFDVGWAPAMIPEACKGAATRIISSEGVMGQYDDKTKKVTYCRASTDLQHWKVWFSPPNAYLPADTGKWLGYYWNGKIWYNVADSGYLRGTDDGLAWTKIPLPADFFMHQFMSETPGGSQLILGGWNFRFHDYGFAVSTDLGFNWKVPPSSEFGWVVRKLSTNLFLTIAVDLLEVRKLGVSTSRSGPWTLADAGIRGILNNGDDAYVVEEHAIYKLVLDGVGRLPKPAATAWRVRGENGRLVVDLPSALVGSPWSLRSLDGRKLAGGLVAGDRLELPLGVPGGLLTVGSQARKVPPIVP